MCLLSKEPNFTLSRKVFLLASRLAVLVQFSMCFDLDLFSSGILSWTSANRGIRREFAMGPAARDDKTQIRQPSRSTRDPARYQASVVILEGYAEGNGYPIE